MATFNPGTDVIQGLLEEYRALKKSTGKNAPKLGVERVPRKHAKGAIQQALDKAGIRTSSLKG